MRILKKEIWPFRIALRDPDIEATDNWCRENIGYRFRDWYSYSLEGHNRLYAFKDESTLLVFKLKWGNYATW